MRQSRPKITAQLDEYHRKRDFRRTPEPRGEVIPTQRQVFVIHKHAASHLHYDLRLELGGTLKSWAVPKGPSLDPAVKRLAIQVEDHPLDYADFEGVIPEGEYGGGTVMIWDQGEWLPQGDPVADYRKGHLRFVLKGKKLRGAWSLVRISSAGDKEQWLWIKSNDELASVEDILDSMPKSAVSNRTMEQIAQQKRRVWHADSNDIALPETLTPQLATLVDAPPAGDAWLHEIKYDGYRLICRIHAGGVRLYTRNGNDWSERFPTLCAALMRLPIKQGWLDGEAAVVEKDGTTNFQALQNALSANSDKLVTYFLFDLLYCDEEDLTHKPLIERKQNLASLLQNSKPPLRYSDHVTGNGQAFFQRACELRVEGIVSKRVNGFYRATRSRDWLKIKCLNRQEFVIGGYTKPSATRTGFGALLLGAYQADKKLKYVGRVGTGFTEKTLNDIQRRLHSLIASENPFSEKVPNGEVQWVKPQLVAEIEFAAWTDEGILRHSSFCGLREDKSAQEVMLERPVISAPLLPKSKPKTFHLTNPDKVFYPSLKLTKGDIAAYYEAIATWMLPDVTGRLLTLLRCPNGADAHCFFQKHAMAGISSAIKRIEVPEKNGHKIYLAVDSLSGLMAVVQMGILEVHVWGSQYEKIEYPDRLVFDFDPDEDLPWQAVINAAFSLRQRLEELGLVSFVKTTGGKGLHIVVPIKPQHDWQIIKAFTKAIAEELVKSAPTLYTAKMSKNQRNGKIYIDYVRNSRGATAIANYSTRARQGAPVSVPLAWDELDAEVRSNMYNVVNLPQRLDTLKNDPWKEFWKNKQELTRRTLKALGIDV